MAKVLVLCANEDAFDVWKHGTAFLLQHSAELDASSGRHSLTHDPAEADIILFCEMGTANSCKFAEPVRAHPYYRRFGEKCLIFESGDFVFPILPGLYASLTKRQHELGYTRTGFYLYLIQNAFISHRPCTGNERYLASFLGSKRTHPVRAKLFELGRDDIYVKDTALFGFQVYRGTHAYRERFWAEYADTMADALFSLCPRGQGAGSIRLFESMKMGRACVILSDDWQPNDYVKWSEFSITIPEREASRIPEILDRNAHRAAEMGLAARRAWEQWFSEKACFHHVVELCLEIQRQCENGGFERRRRLIRQIVKPRNFRWYLQSKKYLYLTTGKLYW